MDKRIGGLPKMRTISDFEGAIVGPFVAINRDSTFDEALIHGLAQIGEGVVHPDITAKVEKIIPLAAVEEAVRCANGSVVVKYSVKVRSYDIFAKFSDDGVLVAYTFRPKQERLVGTASAFILQFKGEDDETVKSKVDVIVACQSMEADEVGIISLDDENWSAIDIYMQGKLGNEKFLLECLYGGDEEFWIESMAASREDMIKFVSAYLDGGMSAAQHGRVWYAHWNPNNELL